MQPKQLLMDIITFSTALEKRIKGIATDTGEVITLGKALAAMREILTELKAFAIQYEFNNVQEEVRFFKEVKPVLLSQYLYCKKKFRIVLVDSFRDNKSRLAHYLETLRNLQQFAEKNKAFYEYCMSGSTDRDTHYFTRHSAWNVPIGADEKFSTVYDVKLARILAHELFKDYLLRAIRKLERNTTDSSQNPLQWTTQKVALVELIYALHAAGVFNYGKTDIKQIVACFEEMFSIDLGNYARVFYEIKLRKKGHANFLEQLKARFTEHIDELN